MEDLSAKLNAFQSEILAGNPLSIVTAFVVIYLVYAVVKRILFPPKGKAPPVASGGLPYLGHAIQFGVDPIGLMKKGYEQHGDLFSITMFGEPIHLFASPEGHNFFFSAKEEEFSACKAYKFTIPVFGPGIVYDAPPEVLVEQRKFVAGGLTYKRFKQYVSIIEKETEEYFAKHWGNEGESEMMQAFNEVTVLTSTSCLQGKEVRDMSSEFAQLYWDLDKSLSALGFFFPNLPLPSMLGRDRARKKMGDIFLNVIRKRRANPGGDHEDIIQTLMECQYKDGSQISDEQIAGMMIALLLAGQHTSNVTGCWTGVHILQNPEVLKKLKEEQKRIFGDGPGDFEKIKACELLEWSVLETLRLRPPIIIMMRRVLKDMEFKGYTLREGTLVGVSPALSHRLGNIYTNPDEFDPARFAPDRAEDSKQPYSYIAFGAGKHACIGESFARLQVKVIWSWLMRHYDIELVTKNVEPNFKCMVVGPVPPVTVRYKRIQKGN